MGNQYKQDQANDDDNCVDNRMVTINGFCFCTAHGVEYCHSCTCDYRMVNNSYIEDYLEEKVSDNDMDQYWEGDDREPIQLFGWQILDNGKPACMEHNAVACQKCFNWGEQLVNDINSKK